jgi:hypothetical protein
MKKLNVLSFCLLLLLSLIGCQQLRSQTTIPTLTDTTTVQTTASLPSTTLLRNEQIYAIYQLALDANQTVDNYEDWLESIRGPQGIPGADGREIHLQVENSFIRWQYDGQDSWTDLIALDLLTGPPGDDGKAVELSVALGSIQWRVEGDLLWTDLISLSTLTGAKGDDGKDVELALSDTHLQWKYTTESEWVDLIELETLHGQDARDVVLGIYDQHLSWQYAGSSDWTPLIDLTTLAGADGVGIQSAQINSEGELVITYTDLSIANLGPIVQWHTVNFKGMDGTLVDTKTMLHGAGIAYPTAPLVTGYTFSHWDHEDLYAMEDMSIRAVYTRDTYTVTYTDHEQTVVKTESVEHMADAVPPILPDRPGYVFTGWDCDLEQVVSDLSAHPVYVERTYSAEEIYELASPATVEIVVYGQWDDSMKLGSGFFISSTGQLVTNYHVIDSGYSAEVYLSYQSEPLAVTGVRWFDENLDLAILDVACDLPVPFLSITDRLNPTGAPVYALGSPLGLTGSLSSGIISTASRVMDDVDYIQITAPLSPGNSGGPLINRYGEVIGVNTATFPAGQNLNLAVNIGLLDQTDTTKATTLPDLYQAYWNYSIYPWEQIASETEPNNQQDTANLIVQNGLTLSGALQDSADQDWFAFSLDADSQLTVMLFPESETDFATFSLTLLDAEGVILANHDLGGFDAYDVLYIQIDLSPTGAETFYLKVDPADGVLDFQNASYDLFYYLD